MIDFIGVKAVLLLGSDLLIIQRDNKPNLRYAGLWDFADGAREKDETPFEYIAKEIKEEQGIYIKPNDIIWRKLHSAIHNPKLNAYLEGYYR